MLISFLVLLFTVSSLDAQTAIPDPIFEDYLETHAEDGTIVSLGDAASMGDGIANNGLVSTDRINTVVSLSIDGLGISDLSGIEDFSALETLICNNNNLSALDISSNTNLISLLCGSNFLTAFSINSNTNLETLNCSDNQIQSLDVSNNSVLESLTASGNQLSAIDVSNNTNLTILSISNNRIAGELFVNNNTNLESLFCSSNQISALNLAANTVLKNLDASNNVLTDLDLSTINTVICPDPQTDPITLCQGSATINVSRNQLTSLIVANGYNDLFAVVNSTDNPDLFCIQIDSGFTPSGWIKDGWTYYSENTCVDIYTYVPDDNFEQALITQGYDDTSDNLVLTANIAMITDLNISNASITSLVGIEDFSALEVLDCSTNTIESLDLSNNTTLLELDVTNNNLSALDLNANSALTTLYIASNAIETMDLINNTALTILNCSNNSLTSLDVSANVLLNDLDCSFNEIESLNVTANIGLVSLLCNDNNLFALTINNGTNTSISALNAINNPNLFCIQVDDVAFSDTATGWQKDASASYNLVCGTYIPDDNFEQALIDQGIDTDGTLNNFVATADINTLATPLDISGLAISDLTGIQDFTLLQDLNCSNNMISELNLESNTALVNLDCSNNQIEDLNLTTNTALTVILCNDNNLLTLNIENGNNGSLTAFNATNNPNLFCINVDDAVVGNIPASWQKDAFAIYNGDCINNRFTAIPDALFEQALIDLGYDDVTDNQVLTANIEHILALDVSGEGISNLEGIQDFKSLIELDCSSNFLDNLNVSGMVYLERLNCSSNYLLTNDVSNPNGLLNTTGTISLKELYCAGNNLSDLDTSQNNNLEVLDCADNNLSLLNINNNTLLKTLNCSNNDLTNLDISSNTNIEDVNCNSNQLDNLNTASVNNSTLTRLSCANNNLSSLLVNNYQALISLDCASNELTQLNVTNNTTLSFLSASINQISDLNLLSNTDLEEVLVSQNELSQLNVSANTLLEHLNCDFNELTQLDLDSNLLLEIISCSSNQLTELDLSNTVDLIEINASSNMLTSLILSNNLGKLKALNVSNNQIESDMDLTTMAVSACVFEANQTDFCPEIISINLSNNLLSFVDIQNGINEDIVNFNASGNPNLDCIQVDDADNVPVNWIKDETTSYNVNCNFGETYVPDDNFEQALIALGYDSGPLDDYVLTANIDILTSLDVSGNAIADFTGIEDFEALESLNCANNVLGEIDLSSNTNLLSVDCSNNQLSNLDVSSNVLLTNLNCSSNSISTIGLSANTDLIDLNISSNSFSSFVTSEVLSLQVFNCDNNTIVELDFQLNQSLTNISCQSNLLELLNIRNGQNAILTDLNAQNNPNLTCVETDTGSVPSGATWSIDATAQFAIECFFGQTYVPDDNFEQALIDFGYDSGPLDDYVLTENIDDINYLNVSGSEISDITGIEDFVNLTSLELGENLISTIDLSNNALLVNLNVSGNSLSLIDLAELSNLTSLDVSNNNLTQINLENNLSLINLDVSNNMLTNLSVDQLINLQDVNCGSNQISSLNFTQNINLSILFCQANILIADQLNIQNGNNENLLIFNATNNPDLGCILVDDPVAVISNTDGLYDNWLKDNTASYQTICEDADNDGVPNEDDLCPSTEFGATVDLFGCAIIDLPNDNFTILITGESCMNSNDGKISIETQELYAYTATLTSEDFYQEYNFTNSVDMLNLLAGTYEMCITIAEWPDYESCYTIIITQPEPLEVFASRSASGNEVSVDLSGSASYKIEFNGDSFITHNSTINLQLQQGVNNLKVSTDLDCQGIYEKQILMTNEFMLYPNPFEDQINISKSNIEEEITVRIYSNLGQLVAHKIFSNQDSNLNIDTSQLEAGFYMVKIESKKQTSVYKIVKK